MPSKGGLALRGSDSLLRALEFLCAALILGIFSWFLAYLTKHDQNIPKWMKAVEGISGAAVIYTAFATLLTCFLGGISFFAFLAILLDVLFIGGFVAIAILARGGVHTQASNSPLGNGNSRDSKLQTAAFAVAIIGAFLFLLTAIMAILLQRHHKKEKKYGPSPKNNYTSGAGKKSFFSRKKKNHDTEELGAVGGGSALIAEEKAHHHKHHNGLNGTNGDIRPSHDTGMTGSTAAVPETTAYGGSPNKYNDSYANQNNAGYQAYNAPQEATGTAHSTAYPTTERGYGHGIHHQEGVIHDPNPYAHVHGSGAPHQAAPGEDYVR